MTTQPHDQSTNQPPWYVLHTKPRRELLVAGLLARVDELTLFLPEVLQQGAKGAQRLPLFPGYLFVQVDLQSRAAGQLRHTPGLIGLVGSERQPTPVADAVVRLLQERVRELNRQGGLLPHGFQSGEPVIFTAGPLQGLAALFVGPLTPTRRVQVLLHFLGQEQQMTVDVRLLEKRPAAPQPPGAHPPRRSRGKGRPIQVP